MGDSVYGSAVMLDWHDHGIEPHVTVFDKSARKDGTFARDDFTYDYEGDGIAQSPQPIRESTLPTNLGWRLARARPSSNARFSPTFRYVHSKRLKLPDALRWCPNASKEMLG